MNKDLIKQGFIKRAKDYGIESDVALWIFKQADLSTALSMANQTGAYTGGASAINGAGLGGLAGAAIGGVSGLMNDTPDENGETHRLWNGVKGLGIGAGVGAGLGAAGGYAAGVAPNLTGLKDAIKWAYGAPKGITVNQLPQFQVNGPTPPVK